MRGLNGKNVIVTGGAGAIGGAICRHFTGYGAHVGVFDKNLEGAKKIAGEIKGFASGVDITDYRGVAEAIAQFEAAVGPTDILVNNAGWDQFVPFIDTTPELWNKIIAINLHGPRLTMPFSTTWLMLSGPCRLMAMILFQSSGVVSMKGTN
jgi:2-hydroxycyclohexanecarboxyl-CoA dehydrogenase